MSASSSQAQHPSVAALEHAGALRLWLYGLAMCLPLFAFAWRYPLAGNSHTLTDIGKLARYERAEFAGFVAGMVALFALYLLGLRESRRLTARQALPAIFACAALMVLAMEWMYPVNAVDLFLYALRSRLFTSYGADPIAVTLKEFASDPWHPFATAEWAGRTSPYGPLWNLIAAPVTLLAGERLIVALVGFKILATVCLFAGAWVAARVSAALGNSDPATAALFYLWNPLVLWEGVGNGHNDVVLMLPLLLALLAWATRRDALVIPLLVAATLIKYVAGPLILLAALALWRRAENSPDRWRLALRSALLSLLVVAISLAPFYDLDAIRRSVAQQGGVFHTSPAAVAVALLRQHAPGELLKRWASWIGQGLVLFVLGWQLGRLWLRPERLPRACFEIMYVIPLVALTNSRPWYVIWPVALAAVLPWGWPAWRAIAWSAGGLASYGFFIWIEAWWQPGYTMVQSAGVAVTLSATLLLTIAELTLCNYTPDSARGRARGGPAALP